METLLGKDGAYIDGLYYCPHHPHKGYEGERPELKIECECRKPKPAYINDVDGLGVFAQQLFGFGKEGDVFLGISTSGNSKNVL